MNTYDFFDAFECNPKSNSYFVLAVYDIADNKRRSKLSKLLESYGVRVQESAFECYLSKSQIEMLKREAKYIINNTEDSFRLYRMNENDSMEAFGALPKTEENLFIII